MNVRLLLFCVFMSFLWSCAKVSSPSGGEVDRQPPKITESSPIIGSTGFQGKKIRLTFDEFIEVKALSKELISSPPFTKTPEFIIKKKTLILDLPDSLIPNTTYYINFGKAIVDFNEGNPLDSNLMVFSTGEEIDSLTLSGKLLFANNLKPVKEAYVMLYPDLQDSIPCKKRPTYFTKTQEDGSFTLSYLKDRPYQIFALQDQNANYKFDLPNESIAFLNEAVSPYASDSAAAADSLILYFFTEDYRSQTVTAFKEVSFGKFLAGFSLPVSLDSVSILLKNGDEKITPDFVTWDASHDSAYFWLSTADSYDSISFSVSLPDTLRQVMLYPKERPAEELDKKQIRAGKEPFTLEVSTKPPASFFETDSVLMGFNHPLKTIDTTKAILYQDSLEIPFEASINSNGWLVLRAEWEKGKPYRFMAFPDFATDLFQLTHDTISVDLRPKGEADFGYVYLTVAPNTEHAFVFELYDEKENLIEKRIFEGETRLAFEYLKAGNYTGKLIYDTVPDGVFTPGKYGTKRQAEKVVYYPQPIEVQANWELDLRWDL